MYLAKASSIVSKSQVHVSRKDENSLSSICLGS